jgi:hypothetical protein
MDWVLGPIAPLCCSIAWDHRCLPCYAKEAIGNETLCLSASASAKVHVHAIMDRGYILDSSHQCQMHDEASHHKCCAYQTSLPPLLIPITPGSSNLTSCIPRMHQIAKASRTCASSIPVSPRPRIPVVCILR